MSKPWSLPATRAHRRFIATLACSAALLVFASPARALQQQAPAAEPQQVQQWLQQGSQAMQAGRPADAVEPFEHAAAAEPGSAQILMSLGLAELGTGQFAKAHATLLHALTLDPQLAGAHLFLGITDYQAGDAKTAADEIQQELTASPDNVEALTWMGMVELSAGNPEQAAASLDHAATLAPTNPAVLYYQGRAHSQIAANAYRALYRIDPDSALVHRALAETLADSNQPAKAIDEYQAALRKQPNEADLYEELGDEEQKVSRFDDAASAYQHELKLNPHSAIALYNIGKIDVEQGRPQQGVTYLRQAVTLGAVEAPSQFYLGFGLAQLQQNAAAAKALEASLAASPSAFIEQSAWYQLGRVYQRLGRAADAQHAFAQVQKLKSAAAAQNEVPPGTSAH